jgi:hypothetical protein
MLNFLKSRILYHPDLSRSLLHFNIELDIGVGLDSAEGFWAMFGGLVANVDLGVSMYMSLNLGSFSPLWGTEVAFSQALL